MAATIDQLQANISILKGEAGALRSRGCADFTRACAAGVRTPSLTHARADLLDVTQKQSALQSSQLDADLAYLSSLNKLQRWLERVHEDQVGRGPAGRGQRTRASEPWRAVRVHARARVTVQTGT